MRLIHIMVNGIEGTGYKATCSEFPNLVIVGAPTFSILITNINTALATVLQEQMDVQIFYTYNFIP